VFCMDDTVSPSDTVAPSVMSSVPPSIVDPDRTDDGTDDGPTSIIFVEQEASCTAAKSLGYEENSSIRSCETNEDCADFVGDPLFFVGPPCCIHPQVRRHHIWDHELFSLLGRK